MKLSTATIVLASTTATANAVKTISGKNSIEKILRGASSVQQQPKRRRLDEEEEDGEDEEYAFLSNYNLKFVSCMPGEQVINPENGEYEYDAVTLHLCPTSEGCDSDSDSGCKMNYGSLVVSAATFADAWFEDQRDIMQWDDNFQVDEYTECREYDVEDQDGENDDAYEGYQFYIGPTCTDDGLDIRLGLFEDEVCRYESEHSFEDISNGWSLPYGDGGLVSKSCIDCQSYDDDGNAELREMCEKTYEFSPYKCETDMEYVSYYGANEQGCEYIQSIEPRRSGGSTAGKALGWIIFALFLAAVVGYVSWWRKKKAAAAGASDGVVA